MRRFICMEFSGLGDPFFGGSGDERTLLENGKFGHCLPGTPARALFDTDEQALVAGSRADNLRTGAELGAIPWECDASW